MLIKTGLKDRLGGGDAAFKIVGQDNPLWERMAYQAMEVSHPIVVHIVKCE